MEFRVWDDTTKKMYYYDDGTKNIIPTNLGLLLQDPLRPSLYEIIKSKYDPMLCVGTLKYGKKVYQGDIFRYEEEEDYGDNRVYSMVMWVRQRSAFYLIPLEHVSILEGNDCEDEDGFKWLFEHAFLSDFSNALDLTVYIDLTLVGNIYENPELKDTDYLAKHGK